jgi:hypothetical protein
MKTVAVFAALLILVVAGCSFVTTANKTLYTASVMGDGGMKVYAAWWKGQTNAHGATTELLNQRSNVMQSSTEVGMGIMLADKSLMAYKQNVGTNQTTKAAVEALITTAIQRAASFAGYVGALTGNTNLLNYSANPGF